MIFWLFVFVFLSLVGNLTHIQIVNGRRLTQQAVSQQTQSVALEVPARGQILDRKLRPLTDSRKTYRVVVFPAAVTDSDSEAVKLATVLHMDRDKIKKYLEGRAQSIPLDLNAAQKAEVTRLGLPGIVVVEMKIRDRKPELASHVIGYLGSAGGLSSWVGETGIERFYDRELRGTVPESQVRIFIDGRGRLIQGLKYTVEENLVDDARNNVVLTIDRDIQGIVENAMDNAGIRDGAVVVMDLATGDIAAMASRPEYNLGVSGTVGTDVYRGTAEKEMFLNHSLSLYQPGSVFKVIVASAALEEGLVKPDTMFNCIGEKDPIVKCYEKKGHGLLSFAQAVAYSCNPTFARVGIELGADRIISFAQKFGLAQNSIIGYTKNDLKDSLNTVSQQYNLVNASLGQWPIKASVVQVTAMMNVIAAGGVYTEPRLVMEIRSTGGKPVRSLAEGEKNQVISRNTAETMQQLLEKVTTSGTGKQAWIEPWGSAGKTGSAQVGQNKLDAWFSGYAPLKNPRYVATVLVTDGESGGKTAAPVFKEIMLKILALQN